MPRLFHNCWQPTVGALNRVKPTMFLPSCNFPAHPVRSVPGDSWRSGNRLCAGRAANGRDWAVGRCDVRAAHQRCLRRFRATGDAPRRRRPAHLLRHPSRCRPASPLPATSQLLPKTPFRTDTFFLQACYVAGCTGRGMIVSVLIETGWSLQHQLAVRELPALLPCCHLRQQRKQVPKPYQALNAVRLRFVRS